MAPPAEAGENQRMASMTDLTRRTLFAGALLCVLAAGPAFAEGPRILGTLDDGKPVGETDLAGWRLVYFGYTHCPDVCPLGLQSIAEAIDTLGPLAEKISPVFVTVDPDRDGPEVMRHYVDFFHPKIRGVTPGEAELKSMAAAWRIKYRKVEIGEGRPYLMDHTASILLIDPAGVVAGRLPHDLGGARIAEKIRSVLEHRS
jgi:protein SCO1/2